MAPAMDAPTGVIWRANTRGAWIVRNPPRGSHGERWARHGGDSFAACLAALTWVWWEFWEESAGRVKLTDLPAWVRDRVEAYAAALDSDL